MKNSTLILIGLIGVGLYLYLKKQKPNVADLTVTNLPPSTPNSGVMQTNVETQTATSASGETYNVHFQLNGVNRKLGKIPNTI